MTDWSDIENMVTNHSLDQSSTVSVTHNRQYAMNWLKFMTYNVPEGRERDIAFAKVEEAMFWSNAGIARHQEGSPSSIIGQGLNK